MAVEDDPAKISEENRLIALTFIESYLIDDEEQSKAARNALTPNELIYELRAIAIILAAFSSLGKHTGVAKLPSMDDATGIIRTMRKLLVEERANPSKKEKGKEENNTNDEDKKE